MEEWPDVMEDQPIDSGVDIDAKQRKDSWMSSSRLLLAMLCLPVVFEASSCAAFEFLDDFHKPCRCQRDPFEERIETERHDFTQSATTVGRGIVQIESGYSYFFKETPEEKESAHTFPELLLRIGLSEDIEFRLRWNHAWVFKEEEPDRIGAEDLRFGFKLQLTRERCNSLLPTSALEIRGLAPTGADTFSTGTAQFSLDYIYQWTLVEGITLAGSTGFGTEGFGEFGLVPDLEENDYFNAYSQSAVLGFELGEKNTLYTEWFGIFSDGLEEEFSVSVLNAGIDHYFSDNFVFDIRMGFGLTEDSDDFFTGVGGGFRF